MTFVLYSVNDNLCPYTPSHAETLSIEHNSDTNTQPVQVRQLSDKQRSVHKTKLIKFRQSILARSHDTACTYKIPLYVEDIACGLSESIIDSIVESCDYIETVSDLEEKCLIFGCGQEIVDIIENIV